jgi:hypothetical protein
MAILKYYLGLFRFAINKAWITTALVLGILTLISSYLEDKHPDWMSAMNTPIWKISLAILIVLFAINLIRVRYTIKRKIRSFLKSNDPRNLQKIDAGEEIVIYIDPLRETEFINLSKHPAFDKFLSFDKSNNTLTIKNVPMSVYHIRLKYTLTK